MNDSEHDTGRGEHEHHEPTREYESGAVDERVRDYEEGRVPAPAVRPRFPLKVIWRHISLRQFLRDVFQIGTGLMIVFLFLIWGVFGQATVSKQNQEIIKGVRADLLAHAQGSQERQCAIATELEFFFAHPAHVKGQPQVEFVRPKWQLEQLRRLKAEACAFRPLP